MHDDVANTYINMLKKYGENGLYRKAIGLSVIKYASDFKNPEIELLNISESFFLLYRRKGEDIYFTIGKIFRRAAHTLYRNLQKEADNKRFIRAVK